MPQKKFQFTKSELTKAFQKWNTDYLENPGNYPDEVSADKDCAENQADTLLKFSGKLN